MFSSSIPSQDINHCTWSKYYNFQVRAEKFRQDDRIQNLLFLPFCTPPKALREGGKERYPDKCETNSKPPSSRLRLVCIIIITDTYKMFIYSAVESKLKLNSLR